MNCPFKKKSERLNDIGQDAVNKWFSDYASHIMSDDYYRYLHESDEIGFQNPKHIEEYDNCDLRDKVCVGEDKCPIMKK